MTNFTASRRALIRLVCAAVILGSGSFAVGACHDNSGSIDTTVTTCSPSCESPEVCCYSCAYATNNPDGGRLILADDDANAPLLGPVCGTAILLDAADVNDVNAIIDGGTALCGFQPAQ